MAVHFRLYADRMAVQRKCVCPSSSQTSGGKTKHQVSVSSFEKWQHEFEHEYQTILWLRCDKYDANRSLAAMLYCEVCRRFEDRTQSTRNFSVAWLTGTTNHTTSNVLDHAKSEQHVTSMARLQEERAKAQGTPTSSYALIVRSITLLDNHKKERMKQKFEICYVLAKESLAFLKYPVFHAPAEHQRFELGSYYKTTDSAKFFTHFTSNVEQEQVFMLFCYKDDNAKEIHSYTRYLAVVDPLHAKTEGLAACLGTAL